MSKSGVYTPADNNVAVQLYEEQVDVLTGKPRTTVVFTTGDREIAKVLELVCEDANITDSPDEFHYQGWVEIDKARVKMVRDMQATVAKSK